MKPDTPVPSDQTEYIVVTDNTSEVSLSTPHLREAVALAAKIRRAGGAVTIFTVLNN